MSIITINILHYQSDFSMRPIFKIERNVRNKDVEMEEEERDKEGSMD